MQLGDLLCCLLLTITVTASYASAEETKQKTDIAVNKPRKLIKRDAALFIDNFAIEPVYTHKPKVIYRRVSRHRYGSRKPKHGPPRPKYGPPPKQRKPAKKFRKPMSNKYGPPSHKKKTPKPRYGPPKRPTNKTVYGPPKKNPAHYHTSEPAGFAEPPVDYENQDPLQFNDVLPLDSYGAPLKPTLSDIYPSSPSFSESTTHFDNQDFTGFGQEYQSWQNYQNEQNGDHTYAYSKKRPLFAKPDDVFNVLEPSIDEEDFNIKSYSDVYNYQNFNDPQYLRRKKKPQYFSDTRKKVNKHWKAPKLRPDHLKLEPEEEILVGGQYAEPPARYVPKFQPSAPMFTGNDDFNPPQTFLDPEVAASATISPYVNYKHSNMAFSPQNLNDAFSIVDK